MNLRRKLMGRVVSSAVLFTLMICIVPSTVLSQDRDEDTRNQLALIHGGRINGYLTSENDKGEFFVEITGATNPDNGKKLDGTFDFAYRCANVATVIVVAVIIARGRFKEKVRCMAERDPFIYY